MNKNYYTPKELSELIGAHHFTILRLIKEGEIKALNIGNRYLIAKADAKKFIKARSNPSDGRKLTIKEGNI